MIKKVYLAGQSDEHDNSWKKLFKSIDGLDFHDWELDSDQTSPDTFFPDDLNGIKKSDYMVANPGLAPSEGTWIEIGYFYAQKVKNPGKFCDKLIIIWQPSRNHKWSLEFVKKAGFVVESVEDAKNKLIELTKIN